MADHKPQIAGLGNPLVDVLAQIDSRGPARHGLICGEMHLVDSEAADRLYAEIGPGTRQSGGSVANTIAHVTDLGLSGTFLGKVADDELGHVFLSEMQRLGIDCPILPDRSGVATGRSVIMVTPDGERTMSTYLGACENLSPEDLPGALPEQTAILLIEGYHFDTPAGARTIERAADLAEAVGAVVALTPSDPACVARHLDVMRSFLSRRCGILIGNVYELCALAGVETAAAAMDWGHAEVGTVALTLSEDGALVSAGGTPVAVPALPVKRVVDSTGAGDAYAAGFLGAIATGAEVAEASAQGARLAARVISHVGARQAR